MPSIWNGTTKEMWMCGKSIDWTKQINWGIINWGAGEHIDTSPRTEYQFKLFVAWAITPVHFCQGWNTPTPKPFLKAIGPEVESPPIPLESSQPLERNSHTRLIPVPLWSVAILHFYMVTLAADIL
jgi:hypothetical protein